MDSSGSRFLSSDMSKFYHIYCQQCRTKKNFTSFLFWYIGVVHLSTYIIKIVTERIVRNNRIRCGPRKVWIRPDFSCDCLRLYGLYLRLCQLKQLPFHFRSSPLFLMQNFRFFLFFPFFHGI